MATVLDKPVLDQHRPWHISYQQAGGSGASWAQRDRVHICQDPQG